MDTADRALFLIDQGSVPEGIVRLSVAGVAADIGVINRQTSLLDQMLKRRLDLISTAGIAVVALCIFYGYRNVQSDDAYIFYTYARNIADGSGYVFNVGERVNATTSPLYTLMLALSYRVLRFIPFVTIPLLAHVIGVVSLFFTATFLRRSFRSLNESLFTWALPLVVLASPVLSGAVGMETFLAMAMVTGCLAYYVENRRVTAALWCSLAVLARIDMILFAAVLLVYDLSRQRRLPTLGATAAFVLPIVVWLTFSAMYFGQLLPSTVAAKLAQTAAGLWGDGPVFLKRMFHGATLCYGVGGNSDAAPIAVLLLIASAVAAAAGLLLALTRFRSRPVFLHPGFQLILLWNVAYVIIYGLVIDAPGYSWYYTPLVLGMSLFMTVPFETLRDRLVQNKEHQRSQLVVAVILALVVVGAILPLVHSQAPVSAREANYRQAAEWLDDRAPDGTSVGANDIGILGFYYTKGTIVDGGGLVTPAVLEHLRQLDGGWYIRQYQPEYLMFLQPPRSLVRNVVREDWFRSAYEVDTTFGPSRGGVAIYSRR